MDQNLSEYDILISENVLQTLIESRNSVSSLENDFLRL
jgi:hypothetical protein